MTEELFAAIKSADEGAVEQLLDADPGLAGARDRDGLSAIMVARYFSWSRTAIVDRLVAARGEAALDVFEASATGRTAQVRALLLGDPAVARAWSADGYTPLHLAAFFGAEPAVELLLEAGADPEVVSRNDGEVRPIHSAVAGGAFGVARRLIEAGVDVDAIQRDGFRPLHAAAQNGDELLVDLLLQAGADPRLPAGDGRGPAEFAAEAGHTELAERLTVAAELG